MLALALICPQISWADGFTGREFLAWSEASQRGYIDAQLVMASSIVTRSKPDYAQCLADHFYSSTGLTDEGFQQIIGRVREYAEYHPSSVLVVVIESECGAFF